MRSKLFLIKYTSLVQSMVLIAQISSLFDLFGKISAVSVQYLKIENILGLQLQVVQIWNLLLF